MVQSLLPSFMSFLPFHQDTNMQQLFAMATTIMGMLTLSHGSLYAFSPLLRAIYGLLRRLFRSVSSFYYFDIPEVSGDIGINTLYEAVHLYLSTTPSVSDATYQTITRAHNASSFTFGLPDNQTIIDTFRGAAATWEHVTAATAAENHHAAATRNMSSWHYDSDYPPARGGGSSGNEEQRRFTLRINKKDKPLILQPYLDHIMERAADVRRRNQQRRLYTNSSMSVGGGMWSSVPFKHPSTFETLAMNPDKKEEIIADLDSFVHGGSFYQKTGRAWKRGYLLYGPPGTGKSSMIAAMANYLGYDIYDLELTQVYSNSDLRMLLTKTTSKSIIVIEDIDCSVDLKKRTSSSNRQRMHVGRRDDLEFGGDSKALTLSGLLNFTDGLWSCCGSERIFVFTTNHIENIDPALLRSGRMDMHIHMGLCSFDAAQILIKNYLGFEEEEFDCGMMTELAFIIDGAEMSPADISEVLIKNRQYDKLVALEELLDVVRDRWEERSVKRNSALKDEEEEKEEEAALKSDEDDNNDDEDIPQVPMAFEYPQVPTAFEYPRLGGGAPIRMRHMFPFP